MGLAKAGGRFGPAKHLLNALAHLPTDHIARLTGPSDRRSQIVGLWCSAPQMFAQSIAIRISRPQGLPTRGE
jgi:hypothetical protein